MHDYHYTKVKETDKKAYGGSFTIGILIMLYVQIKYNHGLF